MHCPWILSLTCRYEFNFLFSFVYSVSELSIQTWRTHKFGFLKSTYIETNMQPETYGFQHSYWWISNLCIFCFVLVESNDVLKKKKKKLMVTCVTIPVILWWRKNVQLDALLLAFYEQTYLIVRKLLFRLDVITQTVKHKVSLMPCVNIGVAVVVNQKTLIEFEAWNRLMLLVK